MKNTLFAAGALVGFLALVAVAVLLFVDIDAYRSRMETAASEALRMDVNIGGRAGVGFFPDLHVTLEDVHIRNLGADVVSAERADLGIDLLPLLHLEVRFGEIALERYRISIERGVDGKFNYEGPEESKGTFPALDLAKVSLSDGTLHYADKQSGGGFEAGDCSLDVSGLRNPGGKRSELLKKLSITAKFVCGEIRTEALALSDVEFSLNGKDGVFEFDPVTMLVFGGQGSGSVQVDHSGPVPRVHVHYSILEFHIEEFLKTLSPERIGHGPMDFSVNLWMQGTTTNELRQTADGEISLGGSNLTLDGKDLDKELSRYASSQTFNLVDVGAFFFAGPIGLAVTRGYNFASLFRRSGGSTRIRTLVSNWNVERGVAHAKDVALATNENRLALQGGLDFVNQEFEDVTVAHIDAKGCPKVRQKIRGPFLKPVVEKPNFLKSLAGPGTKLIQQARDLLPGGQCEVFYTGAVTPSH